MNNIFELAAIDLDFENQSTDKLEVIPKVITNIANKIELGCDVQTIIDEVLKREALSTTGFGKNLAMPHAQVEGLKRAIVIITRYTTDVQWQSMDQQPVQMSFMILVPKDNDDNSHLKILSQLARKMMNQEFVDFIKACHEEKAMYNYINQEIKL